MALKKFILISACFFSRLVALENIFQAEYDVYWHDWPCGVMRSTLVKDDCTYTYRQEIESSVWFFSFYQEEQSEFITSDQSLIPSRYFYRKEQGSTKTHYIVDFTDQGAMLTDKQLTAETQEMIPYTTPCFDRLLLQLYLMTTLEVSQNLDEITLAHIDRYGMHHYVYELKEINSSEIQVTSTQRSRRNVFTLDKNRHYIPAKFEQFKKTSPLLSGNLRILEINESAWQEFKRKLLSS